MTPEHRATATPQRPTSPGLELYSRPARAFHWIVVALILVQVPLGLSMKGGEESLKSLDGATNVLFSFHKFLGVTILAVVALRLAYRLTFGAPKPEPTITAWQRVASLFNHWSMYALLFIVPILGWVGVSYLPALSGGLVPLPALVAPLPSIDATTAQAEEVLEWHEMAAFLLLALVVLHVSAALYHRFIRHDSVLRRMLPRRSQS